MRFSSSPFKKGSNKRMCLCIVEGRRTERRQADVKRKPKEAGRQGLPLRLVIFCFEENPQSFIFFFGAFRSRVLRTIAELTSGLGHIEEL